MHSRVQGPQPFIGPPVKPKGASPKPKQLDAKVIDLSTLSKIGHVGLGVGETLLASQMFESDDDYS